ncbi:S-adenosyl-l-methionine hydroxide adenosyltransferase family protein [Phycisphaerales bacterium AB-hyl4]|uniref:S-adenosyl-l-methionine hydroxide adenosyltransferase family protein n=1 Tax=Natronomicrosphaera hydrolytica TaxID=3242702 RepID=A0ABV4U315_9BACT
MPTITLLTDFGLTDTYVGQMKGVIHTLAPDATVIDLTHDVPPQQIIAGAVMLDAAVDAFDADTIHLAVVDPGVGTPRRPIALRTSHGTYVGPDNGLFTAILDRHGATHAVALTNRHYHRDLITATFHGRDIFAPAAAHLARGVAWPDLGEPIDPASLVRLHLPQPQPHGHGLTLHVVWIDHFGNLITDLKRDALDTDARITLRNTTIPTIARTFGDVPPGEPVAYFGSTGRLEIAVRNGSAAARFTATPGTTIDLQPADPTSTP